MKICAVVAEYNPFHNGHFHHLQEIKKISGCDTLLCIMSGNFTQRGEIAVTGKYTRAAHAIKAGADIVIELPAVYATANAELFAKGALQILKEIPAVSVLSFGCETGDRDSYFSTAAALSGESKEFKQALKEALKDGKSHARARYDALRQIKPGGADLSLLDNPNSILGLEYAKAILSYNANIDILPVKRLGSGYNDGKIKGNFSSASAIRAAIEKGKKRAVKKNMPQFSFKDIRYSLPDADGMIFYSLLRANASSLAAIADCTEGLENRIKALLKDSGSLSELIDKISTRRYTKARIRRICLSCFLGIDESLIRKCLSSDLYLKVLGISEKRTDILSEIASTCKYPLIARKSDYKNLSADMLDCFEKDTFCNDVFNFIAGEKTNEYIMPVVKS